MSEPFVGEIRMVGFNFAPVGWAFCDGQLLSIASYTALFSLLGTTYGGDGRSTFALPDMRGRCPIHRGQGPGLSPRTTGQRSGTETVALAVNQMPAHNHSVAVAARCTSSGGRGGSNDPAGRVWGTAQQGTPYANIANADMAAGAVQATEQNAGSGASHNNMPPWLCVSFIIALVGLYPSRS